MSVPLTSAQESTKSCLQGGITLGTMTQLSQISAKQLCKNGPGVCWARSWPWASIRPLQWRWPAASHCQQPKVGHPSLCSAPVTHQGQQCCVQCWAPQYKRDRDFVQQVQQKAAKMMKGLELLAHEERQESCSCSPLVKRRLGGTRACV